MRSILVALLFSSFASAGAQYTPRPVPPSDTTVPVGARLLITVIGQGVQIYKCKQNEGVLAWNFEAPDAQLLDPATHEKLDTHSSGPTWRWKDGSAVTGKVTVSQASQDGPENLPWLRLAASPEGRQTGILAPVVWVRRSETKGGIGPSHGCDKVHEGESVRVPYQALYTFYSKD